MISGDVDRLDEELVAALCILGRVGLHGLEEYYMRGAKSGDQSHVTTASSREVFLTGYLDILTRLDAAGVRTDAVSRGRSS